MQAFFYRHLVPVQDLMVAATGRPMFRVQARILTDCPVKIPAGGTVRVRVAVPPAWLASQATLEISEPPEGLSLRNVSQSSQEMVFELSSDASKGKPGQAGNLIVTASGTSPSRAGQAKTPAAQRRTQLGTLPAIPYEIVRQ